MLAHRVRPIKVMQVEMGAIMFLTVMVSAAVVAAAAQQEPTLLLLAAMVAQVYLPQSLVQRF
jgi:hypothetical protein